MSYDISCKTMIGAKLLYIRLDKVDEFIRVYDGNRYLVLFGPEKYDIIDDRIRYLMSQKSYIRVLFLIAMQESKLTHTMFCL